MLGLSELAQTRQNTLDHKKQILTAFENGEISLKCIWEDLFHFIDLHSYAARASWNLSRTMDDAVTLFWGHSYRLEDLNMWLSISCGT